MNAGFVGKWTVPSWSVFFIGSFLDPWICLPTWRIENLCQGCRLLPRHLPQRSTAKGSRVEKMLGDFGSIWHLFCMSHVKRKVCPFCRSTQPDRQPTTYKIVSDQGTLTTKLTCSFPTLSSIRDCLILRFHVESKRSMGMVYLGIAFSGKGNTLRRRG